MPNILKDGSYSKRHRGAYTPGHSAPYELSRSRIETWMRCKACFWLQQIKGVKPPEIPSFTINTTTDILLKRDADQVRGKATLPILEKNGLGHLIPFEHEDLEKWTESLHFGLSEQHFNFVHEETNIKLGGGLDDVYFNTETNQIHIVDYKSEAQGTRAPEKYSPEPSSIEKPWKIGYKRQMDMYVWIARKKGFDVSSTGYFLYVNAQHFEKNGMLLADDPDKAMMEFAASVIPYEADPSWVEPTLFEIKDFLENQKTCPEHTPYIDAYTGCDLGRYLNQVNEALS